MKRKIFGAFIAAVLIGVGILQVIPVLADTAVTLDHVQITPASVTLMTGATQQFTAQGYDAGNVTISNLNYYWIVTAGGGTINTTGLFTATNVPGTYTNTVTVLAVQGNVTSLANATVIVSSTAGVLDHVQVTPSTATVAPSGTQQFAAQGYDINNVTIPGLTYTWSVVSGGGTINNNGLFTAGTTNGTFVNTIVASATQNAITRYGSASVTVTENSTGSSKTYIQKLAPMFSSLFRSLGFDKLLGGQIQVQNGTGIDTLKAIPGVVQTVSSSSLTILPNGQTVASTFALDSSTAIVPEGTLLAVNDQVIVIMVNDKVNLVVKIMATSNAIGQLPPGLNKQDNNNRDGKETPPGWSQGKKTGWSKNSPKHETKSESDSD